MEHELEKEIYQVRRHLDSLRGRRGRVIRYVVSHSILDISFADEDRKSTLRCEGCSEVHFRSSWENAELMVEGHRGAPGSLAKLRVYDEGSGLSVVCGALSVFESNE